MCLYRQVSVSVSLPLILPLFRLWTYWFQCVCLHFSWLRFGISIYTCIFISKVHFRPCLSDQLHAGRSLDRPSYWAALIRRSADASCAHYLALPAFLAGLVRQPRHQLQSACVPQKAACSPQGSDTRTYAAPLPKLTSDASWPHPIPLQLLVEW